MFDFNRVKVEGRRSKERESYFSLRWGNVAKIAHKNHARLPSYKKIENNSKQAVTL